MAAEAVLGEGRGYGCMAWTAVRENWACRRRGEEEISDASMGRKSLRSLGWEEASPDGSHHEHSGGSGWSDRGATVRSVSQQTGPREGLLVARGAQATAMVLCFTGCRSGGGCSA